MDDNYLAGPNQQKKVWLKVLAFFVILGVCFFLGNIALLLLAMAGGMSFDAGMDIIDSISDPSLKPYVKAGIGFNHLIIFTGTAVVYALWIKREHWKQYFDLEKVDFKLMLNFIFLLICAYPLITTSALLLQDLEWANQIDEGSMEALMRMLEMDGAIDLLVNLIIVAALPALGEELLFRGVVQKEFIRHMDNHHVAIILASFIFSAVHLQIQGFLPKFIIGLIVGYAYYWTKSLWYPIVIHFINNTIPTLAIFIAGDAVEEMEDEAIQPENWYLLIVVVISCFLCAFIIKSIRKQLEEKRLSQV